MATPWAPRATVPLTAKRLRLQTTVLGPLGFFSNAGMVFKACVAMISALERTSRANLLLISASSVTSSQTGSSANPRPISVQHGLPMFYLLTPKDVCSKLDSRVRRSWARASATLIYAVVSTVREKQHGLSN